MKKIFAFILFFSFSIINISFSQSPSQNWNADIYLGSSFPYHNGIKDKINPNGFFGADISYRFIEPAQNFISNEFQYAWGSRINSMSASIEFHSDKISRTNKNSNKISSELIKFQLSNYQGSGYLHKYMSFYPYYNNSLGFSYLLLNPNKNSIDADEFIIPLSYMLLAPNNIVLAKSNFYTPEYFMSSLKDYNNKIKLGSSRETGFIIQFVNKLNIKFGYDCTIIYPQYVWLQNQTSNLIESSVQNLLGYALLMIDFVFANELSSFGNDLVNSLVTVGFQNLRKTKMHWPLNSDKPLFYDSFKIGFGLQL